jgi:hypothetical protein
MDEPRSPPSEEAELEDLRGRVERLSAALDAARAEAAQLEALAHEDALTGILNRRGFLRDLTRALAYGSRYNAPAALLICDLDAFKLVTVIRSATAPCAMRPTFCARISAPPIRSGASAATSSRSSSGRSTRRRPSTRRERSRT